MINYRFLYFRTKDEFESKLSEINPQSIVFIDDEQLIWTHNRYYGGKQSSQKGLFESFDTLQQSIPNPKVGDWAIVMNDNENVIAVCNEDNIWTLTEKQYNQEEIDLSGYQEKLVSGENLKTINGESLLGTGNIAIPSTDYSSNFQQLQEEVNTSLDEVNTALENVDAAIGQVDSAIIKVNSSLGEVDTVLDQVNTSLNEVNGVLDEVNNTISNIPVNEVRSVIIDKDSYDALNSYDKNTIYFVVNSNQTSNWVFDGTFPITFQESSWAFDGTFPITLI